jgi:hypothetical protein
MPKPLEARIPDRRQVAGQSRYEVTEWVREFIGVQLLLPLREF